MKQIVKYSIFSFIIALLIFVKAPEQASAKTVNITLPTFGVTLNAMKIDNTYRKYPFIVYKDITYFPMTYKDSSFLALHSHWTPETGLVIDQTGFLYSGLDYSFDKQVTKNQRWDKAEIATLPITVNGQAINNSTEPYPLLFYRDITYFPMTWRFGYEQFGWGYTFDHQAGLQIEAVQGYSEYLKQALVYGQVKVGETTYGQLKQMFPGLFHKETAPELGWIMPGTFVAGQNFSFEFMFGPSQPTDDQVVLQKSLNRQTTSSVGHVALLQPNFMNKIRNGMTYEQVVQVIGQPGFVTSERIDGHTRAWSYFVKGKYDRHLFLSFEKVNGQEIVRSVNYNVFYPIPSESALQSYMSEQVTKEKAAQLKIGMTAQEVEQLFGTKYLLTGENFINGVSEKTLYYIGPNKVPTVYIIYENDQVVYYTVQDEEDEYILIY